MGPSAMPPDTARALEDLVQARPAEPGVAPTWLIWEGGCEGTSGPGGTGTCGHGAEGELPLLGAAAIRPALTSVRLASPYFCAEKRLKNISSKPVNPPNPSLQPPEQEGGFFKLPPKFCGLPSRVLITRPRQLGCR